MLYRVLNMRCFLSALMQCIKNIFIRFLDGTGSYLDTDTERTIIFEVHQKQGTNWYSQKISF